MREIRPAGPVIATVSIPGSKSYTHRLLVASALSDGPCRLTNALKSEDTEFTIEGLRRMGVRISPTGGDRSGCADLIVHGTAGKLSPSGGIDMGNCGTGIRLLTAVSALASGTTILTGSERMRQRPISDLLDGLRQMGVSARSLSGTGCPPVEVAGGLIEGGRILLKCDKSSQFLSAILLIAPFTLKGLTIDLSDEPVSKPYIDLTMDVMERFGVSVEREGYRRFFVRANMRYRSGTYAVEPDASNASYFWAAAAVTGGSVAVSGILPASRQGDMGFLRCLEKMGCAVSVSGEGVTVTGGSLSGIDVDMGDMPDVVPTLAVVAAFADGVTTIRNVAHLRVKECDRMAAVSAELRKMGIRTRCTDDTLEITGGTPLGADIETYNDHRIAMAFSVAGLGAPGTRIIEETCVAKSFPGFWDVFDTLYGRPTVGESERRIVATGDSFAAEARKKIILTGFMGTGKSTVGRILADELGYDFVDTDELIVLKQGMSVSRIFDELGEEAFRRIETEIAAELSGREGTVISTGGRMMLDAGNAAALGRNGRVFCLCAAPEEIVERISTDSGAERPLLRSENPVEKIRELLCQRKEGYNRFEQIVTSGKSAGEVARELAGIIRSE